ncbi:calcineurin-like phosphoesterase family protein [Anseongella ginsenosidimutans]|uniref:Calcineurin-like phosphoesterase family protein n=1 Tax=Anseongella ginsenosidimutans TaxID=496056 RepID=A0A4R3KVE3_9SPHI|nr:metallophosphoesterase [Anseongella ginsenosidimutans]QEC51761.1 serine/threonine protein phosphatase [Anseongella ginsenosidimutans]TCS89128.1 calcineurin-like phosphoesterase family protein [Anseongella ginsenosidimutans]
MKKTTRIPFNRVLSLLAALLLFSMPAFPQETYREPALSDSKSWSMILLPDPQTYSKFGRNQGIFELMTAWIRENADELNVKLVLCTGDLVEQNYILEPDSVNGNQTSREQWKAVSSGFSRLDGIVPYVLATGNHDYGYKSAENRYSQFGTYFPPDRNPLTEALLVEMAPNAAGVKTLENACYEFRAGQDNERPFLVFSLEFNPRKAVVDWASAVAARPEYKDHIAVVLTHSYIKSRVLDNIHIEKEGYPLKDVTHGAALFRELIQPSENIQLVFSGHVADTEGHEGQTGFRTDKNSAGQKVHQMMFNAQREAGGWHGNGGDGWLRILEFLPDGKTVLVKTFSPFFAISPSTRHLAWRTESYDEFSFELSE